MIVFSVAGILMEGSRNATLRSLRPTPDSTVKFVEEKDNPHDSKAIAIVWNGVKLGYVPMTRGEYKGSYQDIARKLKVGKVIRYKYTPDNGNNWNDEHNGQLGSVKIGMSIQEEDQFSPVIGQKKVRISSLLGYLNCSGSVDGLINWAFNNSENGTFEGYKSALDATAVAGSLMHDSIEMILKRNQGISDYQMTKEESDLIPKGWNKFMDKFMLDVVNTEHRFVDANLGVTGQYDCLAHAYINGNKYLTVFDWKSSKKPSLKHKLQASFYAKNIEGCDKAVVVAWGSNTKQGYSASIIDRDTIENNYKAICLLKQLLDTMGVNFREEQMI